MSTVQAAAEAVPLTRIPEALAGLWRRCRPDDDDITLSRALTMNFVAVTRCETESCLQDAVGDLLQRHPCRAFLLTVDETCGEPTAGVAGESRRQGRCQEIVLERVGLRGSFRHFANLAGVIRPLLVNDIPTHLYWATGLPPDREPLRLLSKMADHCVLDSAMLDDPAADLSRLQAWTEGGPPCHDLSWLRLRPWRRALAEALEHFPWRAGERTVVTLRHGPGPGAIAGSRLLANWLQQRLEADTALEEVEAPGRQSPEAVELRHGDVEVLVAHDGDARLRVEVSLADQCLLPFHVAASRASPGQLLAGAIDMA